MAWSEKGACAYPHGSCLDAYAYLHVSLLGECAYLKSVSGVGERGQDVSLPQTQSH